MVAGDRLRGGVGVGAGGCALYLAALFSLPSSSVAHLVLLVGGLAGRCTVRGIQLSARVALALEVVSIAVVLVVLAVLRLPKGLGTAAPVVDGTCAGAGSRSVWSSG
ncbi:hypothetical protein O2W18_06975 [Modestobacter sp. VKM Ac-2983]|uniref:hypothetical protein n=1 Tax=Modestobacter sp. VKM Ac-2983 TaxID=3004137 RepID=UPI0022ABACBC|nr:hypothetical protein [Modestobacter sp. VKM Ac-2983]MCZ2804834.1 hypothetical protein [Modestobacter sp. VKM Ac-2983]